MLNTYNFTTNLFFTELFFTLFYVFLKTAEHHKHLKMGRTNMKTKSNWTTCNKHNIIIEAYAYNILMAGKYTITTLNVKGLRQSNKRKCIFQYLKTKQTDICLLQEVHIDIDDDQLWEQEWNQGCFCANVGTRASAGTLILTKLKMTVIKNIIHEPGRLQEVLLQHNDTTLRIFNIYGYNKEQLRIPLLQKLEKALAIVQHCDFLLIGGDFNIVLSNEMDKRGGQNRKTGSQIHINRMMSDHNLVDT